MRIVIPFHLRHEGFLDEMGMITLKVKKKKTFRDGKGYKKDKYPEVTEHRTCR